MMTALAGYDSRDPFSLDQPVDYLGSLGKSIRGAKIAYAPVWDVFPVEAAVKDGVARAVRAFEDAGAIVEEVTLGLKRPQGELSDLWCRMIMPLSLATFAALKRGGLDLLGDHSDDFPPEYLHWVEIAQRMTALDFYQDQEIRTEVYQAIQGTLDDYDLIVGPTLCCLPVKNADDGNTLGPKEINGEAIDPLIGWCPTYLINFTGHPAATVPAGLSADGLPIGMQIVGRRFSDDMVLAASAAFERLRPWADTYKAVEARMT